jgi:membrane fusion protein (multidrug efflux system)
VNRKLTSVLGILALLLALLAISGCGSPNEADASSGESGATTAEAASNDKDPAEDSADGGDDDGEGKKKEEAVPVEIAELELGGIESVLRFSSNLEAEEKVRVFSQAKRLVTDLLVEEGDRVGKDQVLLRLQDDEQRSALAKAKSQLDKAQREFERQKRLFAQDLISEKVYNDANYELAQLQIAHEDAERELGYTQVRAPIGGTVTGRMVNLGDQVQIGQELFDIVDFESIVALVYVPEKHLSELRPGLTARLSAQITGGADYEGRVERISPIVDPRSGTVKVTIDVGGQAGLRPGMYVDVNLVTATREDAVLVPKRALVYDNEQVFVYRVTGESRAERVFIETALTDKFYVEPREGLVKGDRVVVAGQAGLKDGALVKLPGQEEPDQSLEASEDSADVVERASR